jgi:hypothetical protein
VAVARDVPLFGHLGATAELWPLLQFNQTRLDYSGRMRVGASALALSLTLDLGPPRAPWGVRVEVGSGLFYGWERVPDRGSQFNFFNQGGARLVRRLGDGSALSIGWRRVHISNLGLAGAHNPGLSLSALVLAWDLAPRAPRRAASPASE